ncbi:nuclear segregation protein Bfr1 [Pseudohyphozyma bogoriensis]|nr:nuclear segregation protein Bfr1 [Pseudohyphozyma bogoriensis]
MVVGLANAPPQSKKAQAAAKKQAGAAPLNPNKGRDPAATTVEKPAEKKEHDGRPDKAAYDVEQEKLKKEIDVLQAKVVRNLGFNEVKSRIAKAGSNGPNQERKKELRAQLDALRGDQARIKGGRGKTLDQVKAMQDSVMAKIKELQAAKSKLPYKTVQDVDNQIKALDAKVNAGVMKLVDEKKALMEISSLKKTRKTVESFSSQQAAIDADKAKIDTIRASLDDPEAKAISDKFTAVKAELDKINKEQEELSKSRDSLYEERNAASKELDAVYTKKKESAAVFREANNKFYQKLNEDRAKRMERQRAERQQYEDNKKAEQNQRALEEAQAPAFEREIEDCRTLIGFFQKRIGVAVTETSGGGLFTRADVAGVPKLEVRQVDTAVPAGAVAAKKKGEQEEEYFMGGGGKKKKGGKKVPEEKKEEDEKLNLPFGTLTALLTLGIASPLTVKEVPATIEALQTKKKYFDDNQDRVTKEKIAAAEKRIAEAEFKAAKNGAAEEEAAPAEAPAGEKTEA